MEVNQAPRDGRLTARIQNGEVHLQTYGWLDETPGQLRYAFTYTVQPPGTPVFKNLNANPQTSSQLTFSAPFTARATSIRFTVTVHDPFGATGTAETVLPVDPTPVDPVVENAVADSLVAAVGGSAPGPIIGSVLDGLQVCARVAVVRTGPKGGHKLGRIPRPPRGRPSSSVRVLPRRCPYLWIEGGKGSVLGVFKPQKTGGCGSGTGTSSRVVTPDGTSVEKPPKTVVGDQFESYLLGYPDLTPPPFRAPDWAPHHRSPPLPHSQAFRPLPPAHGCPQRRRAPVCLPLV